ncbi:MAG: hypothetical protein DBX05_04125 [Candidatus Poseidoniales archaeon]|nr:MAG: hypothetical protein DBX05_04125 [Candidatus Poseidoniales archaeon]
MVMLLALVPVSSPGGAFALQEIPTPNRVSAQMYDYQIFVASPNSTAGGDGFLTTDEPQSGGQKDIVVSEQTAQFKSPRMLTNLFVEGYNGLVRIKMFHTVEASNPGVNATYTFTLVNGGSSWSDAVRIEACERTLFNSCPVLEASAEISVPADGFNIDEDEQLVLEISADMEGCQDQNPGNGLPSTDCTATIFFNDIEGTSDHTKLEFKSNALSESLLIVQRDGAELIDGSQLEWYPNDSPDNRIMQFRFQVESSFGRFDINSVRLSLVDPSGIMKVDQALSDSLEGVDDTNWAISGIYDWEYSRGSMTPGEYFVSLEVTDIQGHTIVIEHEDLVMKQFGVSLLHGEGVERSVEYIAPSQITVIPLQLQHRGSSGQLDIDLQVITNFNSNWNVSFDAPGGYILNEGGAIVNPILTIESPQDLRNAPPQLVIRAVGEAIVDGSPEIVATETLYLDLEKVDTYASPFTSIWNENRTQQFDNSSRHDSFDTSTPRFVEDGEFTVFIMEIWNNGFDEDEFRIDILERSKAIIQIVDNDTGVVIVEDLNDGTYHTDSINRHMTEVLQIRVKPSGDRDDSDQGLIRFEVASEGNSSKISEVEFTIQRTFGVRAEPVFDCDSVPLGTVNQTSCSDGMSMRIRVTNSISDSSTSTNWRLINPADLQRNIDSDETYSQWEFKIVDNSGDSIPYLTLAPQQSGEVTLEIDPPDQVEMDSHILYLRIIEADVEDDPAYFDMQFIVEIGPGNVQLEIVQVSADAPINAGEERDLVFRVKNLGNQPQFVYVDVDCSSSSTVCTGWDSDIRGTGNLLTIEAYGQEDFTVEISSPSNARSGERVEFTVVAEPQTLAGQGSVDDEQISSANLVVTMTVEIPDIITALMNEIVNPSPTMLLVFIVALVTIVLGVQNRRNRRRLANLAYEEMEDEGDEDDDQEVDEFDFELPAALGSEEDSSGDEFEIEFDDDDIELLE